MSDDRTARMAPVPAPEPSFGEAETAPQSLVAGTVGDRCVNCGNPLAPDQRYCVSCGERRGKARFTLPASTAPAAEVTAVPPAPSRPRSSRASSPATLVAGVGTLLLAMGVGVLIGHDTSNSTPVKQAQTPIYLNGSGASSSTTASAAGTGSSDASGKHHKTKKLSTKAAAAKPTAKQAQKASQAASKVLGASANLPPATVTQGQSGSGPGFNKKTHKFDGSFFGQ